MLHYQHASGGGTVHPAYQYRVISASSQAHNLYVQLFGELGLVGGVLMVVLALVVALLLATVQSYHVFYASLQANQAQSLQDGGQFTQAAAGFDRAAAGPFSNPDDLTNAGINYYTLAQLGDHPASNLVTAAARAQAAIKQDRLGAQYYFLLARVQRLDRLRSIYPAS